MRMLTSTKQYLFYKWLLISVPIFWLFLQDNSRVLHLLTKRETNINRFRIYKWVLQSTGLVHWFSKKWQFHNCIQSLILVFKMKIRFEINRWRLIFTFPPTFGGHNLGLCRFPCYQSRVNGSGQLFLWISPSWSWPICLYYCSSLSSTGLW